MKNLSLKIAALCAAAGLMFSVSQAATVDATFVGGSGIRSDNPNNNYSGLNSDPVKPAILQTIGQLANGTQLRGVMQFSLSDIGIPQGAVIESVKLVMDINLVDPSTTVTETLSLGIYNLTADITPKEVTWNRPSAGNTWTAGGSFDSPALASTNIISTDPTGSHEFSSVDLTALVQESLDNGDDLVNLLLKLNTESYSTRQILRFGLYGGAEGDNNGRVAAPRLEITFAQVPEPSTVALMIAVPALGLALLRRRNRR